MITFYHDIEQNYDSKADPIGCRKMVSEFLRLEKKYNIPATYNIVGKLFVEQPDLIDSILKAGQEIAFHSYNHQTDWNAEYYSNEISLCRKVSSIPLGYRSPRSQITQNAVQTIWDEGFLWSAESDKHSEPYFIYKGLVRLPITADDWPLYEGKVTATEWVRKFSKIIKSRQYIAFGLHDFVASYDPIEIINAWESILKIAVESGEIIVTFSEAAELYRRASFSKYISSNYNKIKICESYLTLNFKRLIKNEIEKLYRPVVAIISNRHEEIPLSLREIVQETCYLVNEDKEDSKLPVNSVDLIICLNLSDYQFWPDQVIENIKKIAKCGATYIVNFTQESVTSYQIENPVMIKRYFSYADIKRWANQLGPDNLIVDSIEPDDNYKIVDSENQKYIQDKEMNCIIVGKVQDINFIPKNKKLSISANTFHFPNPSLENYRILFEEKKIAYLKPFKKATKKFIKWK
jgi:peptidoglycan/xylan/chitin deacetylase (PgdA/CDA1 family)